MAGAGPSSQAGQPGPSEGLDPYSGLDDFDRIQTSSPAQSNLIDLNDASSRSSTLTSRPSIGHPVSSRKAYPDPAQVNADPKARPSLLDTAVDVPANTSYTVRPTTTPFNQVGSGPTRDIPLSNTARPINTGSALPRDSTSFRHSGLSRHKCGACRRRGQDRSYCNVCQIVYCQSCWNQQFLHAGLTRDTHERTDVRIHEILRASLRPKRSESEQKELHRKDESTTWFGVVREGGIEGSTFKDHGRFWKMMKKVSRVGRQNIYPGLVSFVGHTGAGKSTIVKVLIELRYRGEDEPETPVVGSLEARNCPTSGDVHLYSDPHTAEQDYPILYADCEGLEGGEIPPTGTNLSELYGAEGNKSTRKAFNGSERRITWATTAERQTRHYAVANLYPRFLYTFSDVVIFVLTNGREFENVAKNLLQWAAAALEKSSNQPVLPHAILALNESPNELPDWHWNSDYATRRLLDEYREIIHNNPGFTPYVDYWRRRGKRINSLEELLMQYYSSVIVINIPSMGRPSLIGQQIETLYDQIKLCCKKSRAAKQSVRMLFTADELHPYLVSAFDHFATNLVDPFDFVKFSFTNSPIPMDFAGSIVKLAVMATKSRRRNISVTDIFEELSYMVASSIMLDAARHRKKGTAEAIFLNYLGHCDDALEDFFDSFWPCEFRIGNDRCINVKAGHNTTKGHQRKDGRVIGPGDYQSSFSTESFRPRFRDMIYNSLQQLLKKLSQNRNPESLTTESQDAALIHSESILKPFFKHLGGADSFQSNSVCFCCLMALPEHPLPCGHVLCTSCVQSYGSARGKYHIEMTSCPLNGEPITVPCEIVLKPATAGVRVLTLDGGGIRAVAELEVLRVLEKELGGKIPLRAFFDLIVGTNTGGMIALDLAMVDESSSNDVGTVINNFKRFCEDSFTHANMFSIMPFISKPRYHTEPLERALKLSYANDHLFGWSTRRTSLQPKVSVVSSLNNSKSIVLSNYNRPDVDNGNYIFQRPGKAKQELTVWEVARATVTIPTIFRDFRHPSSHRVYHGGNSEYVNPVEVADLERKLIWPDTEHSPPDILISIGAGYDVSIRRTSRRSNNWRPHSKSGDRALLDPVQSSFDAQDTWDRYKDSLFTKPRDEIRYVRLNAAVGGPVPKLDDVEEMAAYKKATQKVVRSLTLTDYAKHLIASCFFFHIIQPPTEGENKTLVCKGTIECRFADANIRRLGEYFNENRKGNNHYFSIQERASQNDAMEHPLTGTLITKMIERSRFSLGPIDVTVAQRIAIVEISLHFGNHLSFPISGFPRHLQHDETKPMRLQQIRPNRWRPANRDAQREDWTGPSTTESTEPTTNLSQYGNPSYVCGGTKLAFARSELPDQPNKSTAQKRAVELDSKATKIETGQSSIFQQGLNNTRSNTLGSRHPRRQTDPGREGMSGPLSQRNRPSAAARNISNTDQPITRQSRTASFSEQGISGLSKAQSTSHPQREGRQLQHEQTRLVPEANDSFENEATTVFPKPAADGSISTEPQVPKVRSRDVESNPRPTRNAFASNSTQQRAPSHSPPKYGDLETSDILQPNARSGSVRPARQSSRSRHDERDYERRASPSSRVHPPTTSRTRRRRRSSRSSERRR